MTQYPLFLQLVSDAQARAVAQTTRTSLLKEGGLVTTEVDTGAQRDAPNGRAPLQWIAVSGLRRYGESVLAESIACRWMLAVNNVYGKRGTLVEKYDVIHTSRQGGGGEYPLQDGFGWTNGVMRKLMALYPEDSTLSALEQCPTPENRDFHLSQGGPVRTSAEPRLIVLREWLGRIRARLPGWAYKKPVNGAPHCSRAGRQGRDRVVLDRPPACSTVTVPCMIVAAFVAVVVLSAAAARAADEWRPLERDQSRRMLRVMRDDIERYYFDPAYGGVDLAQAYATADERIGRAKALPEALSAIAQFAMEFNDSHTYFIPPRQTVRVDYGWSMQSIGDACYVVDVKPGSDAARQGVSPGDRVQAVNGFRPTRANLWALRYMFQVLRPQPGLHVELLSLSGIARELNLAADVKPQPAITDVNSNAGLQQIAIDFERYTSSRKSFFVMSEPDVVIWKLPTFSTTDADIAYGMRMARRAKALVLDLRGNGGGAEYILLNLVGALNNGDVNIGTTRERSGDKPLIARGAGSSAYNGQLVVLVDSRSASASELLARTVQLTKRGTVVGDHTAGSVMQGRAMGETVAYGEYRALFGVVVTSAEVLMSDGGRLERVGVTPDVEILPSSADLASGHDPALAKALEVVDHPMDAEHAGALLKPFRDAQMHAD